jgi:hypothetical protein
MKPSLKKLTALHWGNFIFFISFLVCLMLGLRSSSQTYDIYIDNRVLTSVNTMEFDVFIRSNGNSGSWPLRTFQTGYNLNPAFVNGGTLTANYVPGSSDLESTFGKNWGFTWNASAHVLNQSANTGSACPGAVVGDASRKIGTFRIVNSMNWGCAPDNLSFRTSDNENLELELTGFNNNNCQDSGVIEVSAGANPFVQGANVGELFASVYVASTVRCGDSTEVLISVSGGVVPIGGSGTFYKKEGEYLFELGDQRNCVTSVTAVVERSYGGNKFIFSNDLQQDTGFLDWENPIFWNCYPGHHIMAGDTVLISGQTKCQNPTMLIMIDSGAVFLIDSSASFSSEFENYGLIINSGNFSGNGTNIGAIINKNIWLGSINNSGNIINDSLAQLTSLNSTSWGYGWGIINNGTIILDYELQIDAKDGGVCSFINNGTLQIGTGAISYFNCRAYESLANNGIIRFMSTSINICDEDTFYLKGNLIIENYCTLGSSCSDSGITVINEGNLILQDGQTSIGCDFINNGSVTSGNSSNDLLVVNFGNFVNNSYMACGVGNFGNFINNKNITIGIMGLSNYGFFHNNGAIKDTVPTGFFYSYNEFVNSGSLNLDYIFHNNRFINDSSGNVLVKYWFYSISGSGIDTSEYYLINYGNIETEPTCKFQYFSKGINNGIIINRGIFWPLVLDNFGTIDNHGEINLQAVEYNNSQFNCRVNNYYSLNNYGTFSGNGILNNLYSGLINNTGLISPGSTVALPDIDSILPVGSIPINLKSNKFISAEILQQAPSQNQYGCIAFNSNAGSPAFYFEISDTIKCELQDFVSVADSFFGGRRIDVAVAYTRDLGQEFTLIQSDTVIGSFDSVFLPQGWQLLYNYPFKGDVTAKYVGNTIVGVKAFIQGYYEGAGLMRPVLMNSGVSDANAIQVDSMQIEVRHPLDGSLLAESMKSVLNTHGEAFVNFPHLNDSGYIVLKHRNALETWSSAPVVFNDSVYFDFTTASTAAYGNSLAEMEPGQFAMYSGDLNQDGIIESEDYLMMENDLLSVLFGYYSSDLTGDGAVESEDYLLLENNLPKVLFVQRPY